MPKISDKPTKHILLLKNKGLISPGVAKALKDHGFCKKSHRLQFEKLLRLIYCNYKHLDYPRFTAFRGDRPPSLNYYYQNTIQIDNCDGMQRITINSNKGYLQMLKLKDLRFTMKCANRFTPNDRYNLLTSNYSDYDVLSDDTCHKIIVNRINFTYSDLSLLIRSKKRLEWENNDCYNDDIAGAFWGNFLDDSIKKFLWEYLGVLMELTCNRTGECNFKLLILPITHNSSWSESEKYNEANTWVEDNLKFFDTAWQEAEVKYQKNVEMAIASKRSNENNINRLDKFLLELNYHNQRQDIETNINNLNGVGVFLAEIQESTKDKNMTMQRWMIHRLIHGISGLRRSILFHSELRKTNIRSIGDLFKGDGNSERFINDICKNMRGQKAVLITISGMNYLPGNQLNSFIDSFIGALSARITEDQSISNNKCIILLTGDYGWITRHQGYLMPLSKTSWGELNDSHINSWFRTAPSLEPQVAGEFIENLARIQTRPTVVTPGYEDAQCTPALNNADWWKPWIDISSPDKAISSICKNFLGENNINELYEIWRAS